MSADELRCRILEEREEHVAQNKAVVETNAKLLQTIATYERRYCEILGDREKAYQVIAGLERKVAQLRGERDVLLGSLPRLVHECVVAEMQQQSATPNKRK